MYLLDAILAKPLHLQLYDAIKNDIIINLHVGDKLPSIRQLSHDYKISKTTVESAYAQLSIEGYIQSRAKSGYYVVDAEHEAFQSSQINMLTKQKNAEDSLYDFFHARLDKDSFPLKLWKRLFVKAINETLDFGAYPSGQGELGLRTQIANYLIHSREVQCQVEQIIVLSGFLDSMSLVAKILKKEFKTFAIEHPGYHVARKIFEDFEYQIQNIEVDENGLSIKQLQNSDAKLVYITPSHQYPTGVSMPIANRLKLLNWAKSHEGYIIEDDYDSELSYRNRPIPSLQGLDNDDRVIYTGTFSKSLSPALRVSYLVLPFRLIPAYQKLFDFKMPRVSLSTQKTLELFMSEGHWQRHLRKIRTLNRKKHDIMKDALKHELKDTMKIISEGGGLSILIQPVCDFDWEKLKIKAKSAKINLYYAKEHSECETEGLFMGFGGFKEDEIPHALKSFSKVWHECIK